MERKGIYMEGKGEKEETVSECVCVCVHVERERETETHTLIQKTVTIIILTQQSKLTTARSLPVLFSSSTSHVLASHLMR